ncbi:dihydroneopterin aldolase [Maribacter sp. HTCC2170]|uniref:dihydroneopterin aldolase n=1 Tax=Maribacter sp. (strain HTCC2170 / KCCM 42371) TaxID=313603 RepID=UPI00006BD373|nr:dihydroneopterin aldolase [Maribacter sp. HTCC2170]
MGVIKVTNIRAHAHHGCLDEESIIGSEYRVDITLRTDLKKASISDNLIDTVDYVHINHIVKEEMNIPSKLLEHVANRIIDRVFLELTTVDKIKVSVSKINPPIGGDVEMVTVVLSSKRS